MTKNQHNNDWDTNDWGLRYRLYEPDRDTKNCFAGVQPQVCVLAHGHATAAAAAAQLAHVICIVPATLSLTITNFLYFILAHTYFIFPYGIRNVSVRTNGNIIKCRTMKHTNLPPNPNAEMVGLQFEMRRTLMSSKFICLVCKQEAMEEVVFIITLRTGTMV